MKNLISTTFLLLAGAAAANPQSALPILPQQLSLEQARALALQHSPRLQQAGEMLTQQEGVIREIQAARHPQLNAVGNYSLYDKNRLQGFGGSMDPESANWNAGAEASITVFSGGRNIIAAKRERSRYAAVTADQESATQDLLAQVHEIYYNAQLAQETIAVQQAAIEVLQEQLDFAKNRLDAGVGARYDTLQAEVALSNARPPVIRARNAYRLQVDALRRLLGMRYAPAQKAEDIQLAPAAAPEALDLQLEDAVQQALEQRSELEQLVHLLAVQENELKFIGRDHSPQVDLFAGYGIESDQFGGEDTLQGWATGIRLNWDLWNGGRTPSRKKQLQSRIRQLQHQQTELELQVSGEVRESFYAYDEAQSIVQSTHESMGQAEEALRLARNRYQAGKGTQLEVLESQYQLTQSQLERSRALNDLQRAIVRIKRTSGRQL